MPNSYLLTAHIFFNKEKKGIPAITRSDLISDNSDTKLPGRLTAEDRAFCIFPPINDEELSNIANLIGYIPGVGSIIGIGRIIFALYRLVTWNKSMGIKEYQYSKALLKRGVYELLPIIGGIFLFYIDYRNTQKYTEYLNIFEKKDGVHISEDLYEESIPEFINPNEPNILPTSRNPYSMYGPEDFIVDKEKIKRETAEIEKQIKREEKEEAKKRKEALKNRNSTTKNSLKRSSSPISIDIEPTGQKRERKNDSPIDLSNKSKIDDDDNAIEIDCYVSDDDESDIDDFWIGPAPSYNEDIIEEEF